MEKMIEKAMLDYMALNGGPEQFAEFFFADPRGRTKLMAEHVAAVLAGQSTDWGLGTPRRD